MLFRILGMALELTLLEFRESSFSSAKMLMLQAQRTLDGWQQLVICPFVKWDYSWWLENQKDVRLKRSLKAG